MSTHIEKHFCLFKIKLLKKAEDIFYRFKVYFRKLLFPLPLFPFKLITYSIYYLIKSILRFLYWLVKGIILLMIWPFKSTKNFSKTIFWGLIFTYFSFVEYRFLILTEHYGGYDKFFCSTWSTNKQLRKSVVRVVGSGSEGSGFFVSDNKVLTNFHVIDGEPSPKVILPEGDFYTPVRITANKDADLALLYLPEKVGQGKVLPLMRNIELTDNEPVIAAGYAWGTDLAGEVTISEGVINGMRNPKEATANYVQSNLSLVTGMSGGPLVDRCGEVVGVNTLTTSGLSLFVSSESITSLWPSFNDQDITKLEFYPEESPEEAVRAFYHYLKIRNMKEGFNLLSEAYLEKTNFEEWTSRFPDILDVVVFSVEKVEKSKNTVFVEFETKNWVNNDVEYHYYEGTWETVLEDEIYKMNKSKIKEIEDPYYEW